MTTSVLSASVTKASDTNTQGSLHQVDPILVADIRVILIVTSIDVDGLDDVDVEAES